MSSFDDARGVRAMAPGDAAILLPAMARAFAPQPFTRWLVGRGPGALERGMRLLAIDFALAFPFGLCATTHGLHGGAFWLPPDRQVSPWQTVAAFAQVVQVLGINRATPARLRGLRRAERAAPSAKYYYLSVLAVDPSAQGRGIGSALLAPMLARCDAERAPAYLETDTPAALRFYERHGFRVREELDIDGPDVRLWTMWREPEG